MTETLAKQVHRLIVEKYPMYQETAHWTPVICADISEEVLQWFRARKLKRGTLETRNDWLFPLDDLFLFEDPKVAMEFKLLWG